MKKTTIFFFVGVLLICGVVMVYNVFAATPNPGHAKSEIDIGDKSCTWVATAQAAADYSCGTGKYMRGLRFTGFANNQSHTHPAYQAEWCKTSLYCTTSYWATGASGTGPATLYIVTYIECCTL